MALPATRGSVNDCCRLCQKNLRIQGVISNSVLIFEQKPQGKNVFERCQLVLFIHKNETKSVRCCKACLTTISRLERDLVVFSKWQQDEGNPDPSDPETSTMSDAASIAPEEQTPVSPVSSSVSEKREHTPSKTPRMTKKLRRSPPLQTSARKNLTQVNLYLVICVFAVLGIVLY